MNIKNLKMRILIAFILIIAGIFLILKLTTGNSNKENEPEKMKSFALEYLNNNYSDTFTALSYIPSSWAYTYSTVNCRSEKYSDTVEVRIWEENGTYTFKDNYHTMYMYDDAKLYYENIALNLKNYEVKIRFSQVDFLNEYLNFEEGKDKISLDVFYFTNYEVDEQQKQEILNKISGDGSRRSVDFFVTTDNELLKNIDLNTILNNQGQYIKSTSKYFIDYEGNIKKTN